MDLFILVNWMDSVTISRVLGLFFNTNILGVFLTEKPNSKPLERNVVYISKTISVTRRQ